MRCSAIWVLGVGRALDVYTSASNNRHHHIVVDGKGEKYAVGSKLPRKFVAVVDDVEKLVRHPSRDGTFGKAIIGGKLWWKLKDAASSLGVFWIEGDGQEWDESDGPNPPTKKKKIKDDLGLEM